MKKRFEDMVHPLPTGTVKVNLRELFFDGFEISKDVEEYSDLLYNQYFSTNLKNDPMGNSFSGNTTSFKRPNPDAMQWAKEFHRLYPSIDIDTMLGWFANAMMDMSDHMHWTVVRDLENQIRDLESKLPGIPGTYGITGAGTTGGNNDHNNGNMTFDQSTPNGNDGYSISSSIPDREEYEADLKRRQAEHIRNLNNIPWSPCMHDQCTECHGTGVKRTGGVCVHMISCPCPKCSPHCL